MTVPVGPRAAGGSPTSLPRMITAEEFAGIVGLSRRQVDRLRAARPDGFPREYELGSGRSKHGRCPRFKLDDVLDWVETRALW
jgi:predicted DNA-binding transcriptional regulator AlpA